MMTTDTAIVALASLAGLVVTALTASRCWHGWLTLKARELEQHSAPGEPGGSSEGKARIELADLRERIRKLEAIAAGVDI